MTKLPFFHSGGVVGKPPGLGPDELPVILKPHAQRFPPSPSDRRGAHNEFLAHVARATALPGEMIIESNPSHATEIKVREDLFITKNIWSFDARSGFYPKPRTGDMQTMIEDIDRVEETRFSKFDRVETSVRNKMQKAVKQAMEERFLAAANYGDDE